MNNTIKNVLIFVAGGAIGSAVTWKLVKTKYENIAQEEIDSVKEVFANRQSVNSCEKTVDEPKKSEVTYNPLRRITDALGYTEKEKEGEPVDGPYVITPQQFGEIEEYEKVTYTYYADGILVDEDKDVVEDVDGTVGEESLNHFGQYEPDSVYVRNDELKIDYEILLDLANYTDIGRPHR